MPGLIRNLVVYLGWCRCAPRAGPIFFPSRAVLPDSLRSFPFGGIFDNARRPRLREKLAWHGTRLKQFRARNPGQARYTAQERKEIWE